MDEALVCLHGTGRNMLSASSHLPCFARLFFFQILIRLNSQYVLNFLQMKLVHLYLILDHIPCELDMRVKIFRRCVGLLKHDLLQNTLLLKMKLFNLFLSCNPVSPLAHQNPYWDDECDSCYKGVVRMLNYFVRRSITYTLEQIEELESSDISLFGTSSLS